MFSVFQSTVFISIHAAREGGDVRIIIQHTAALISIHAAREGGDVDFRFFHFAYLTFQSTPPVKAATHCIMTYSKSFGISIHAAREGGDMQSTCFGNRQSHFNPRRP